MSSTITLNDHMAIQMREDLMSEASRKADENSNADKLQDMPWRMQRHFRPFLHLLDEDVKSHFDLMSRIYNDRMQYRNPILSCEPRVELRELNFISNIERLNKLRAKFPDVIDNITDISENKDFSLILKIRNFYKARREICVEFTDYTESDEEKVALILAEEESLFIEFPSESSRQAYVTLRRFQLQFGSDAIANVDGLVSYPE